MLPSFRSFSRCVQSCKKIVEHVNFVTHLFASQTHFKHTLSTLMHRLPFLFTEKSVQINEN